MIKMELDPRDIKKIMLKSVIGTGSYGTVYSTLDPDIVVKVIALSTEIDFRSAITELVVLETIKDKYPYKLLGYGVSQTKIYLLLPRCKPVPKLYDPFKLHTELKKCLKILHQQGIAHGDIAYTNVMLFKDQAVFIHFSLSKFCLPTNDGDHVFKGIAYSNSLTDPEFVVSTRNSIRCDLYAFGLTLQHFGYYDVQKYLCPLSERQSLVRRRQPLTYQVSDDHDYNQLVSYLYHDDVPSHRDMFKTVSKYGKLLTMSEHDFVDGWLKMSLPVFVKSRCWTSENTFGLVYRHREYLTRLDIDVSHDIYAWLFNKKYRHLAKLVKFAPNNYSLIQVLKLDKNPFNITEDDLDVVDDAVNA